ncbi:uncharacterized protein K460DRAFT_423738 [Cucurbitaria berberidis CBS 394.84]|uniref:Uncharacterized protein n=1 Tax=Cucurbitaria berberidis CBS 394.84 TaxID=1168544 RepID=A0A9P4GTC4_9PLEO|nr:uncharacterized protein K460DRAFT_423738 [Cucurbitaria berberidis CBS 394.84]KAF1851159.1 hypothetical protein K460DRAFT_423738 [Cucurbitaria berberidis CBS 394.84]
MGAQISNEVTEYDPKSIAEPQETPYFSPSTYCSRLDSVNSVYMDSPYTGQKTISEYPKNPSFAYDEQEEEVYDVAAEVTKAKRLFPVAPPPPPPPPQNYFSDSISHVAEGHEDDYPSSDITHDSGLVQHLGSWTASHVERGPVSTIADGMCSSRLASTSSDYVVQPKKPLGHVWFCCNCGDGPYSEDISLSCVMCEHKRCEILDMN